MFFIALVAVIAELLFTFVGDIVFFVEFVGVIVLLFTLVGVIVFLASFL